MKFSKDYLKIIIPVILFMVISISYFPDVIEGKKLSQHDISQFQGGAKEAKDFQKETGEETLWTNSMFGGMPMYLISIKNNFNIIHKIDRVLKFLPHPAGLIFLAMLSFFIMLSAFGVDFKTSIIGAIAYGFSSFFLIALAAGHNSEVAALAYMPGLFAGIYMVLEDKKLLGGSVLFALFLALELRANHLQITYYALLMIVIYGLIKLFYEFKNKQLPQFLKGVSVLLVATIIAVGVNFANIYMVYKYGKESTRGKSELTLDKNNKTGGLDKDYAIAWSYGKLETFNLFIPNLMGGASGSALSENSAVYKQLLKVGATKMQAKNAVKQMPTYWGPQPFTSGPVYIGALVIFLFVLGLFLVKGPIRLWLVLITVLSIMLAWGKFFMPLTDFFFNYIPGYNKFRNPSRILIIAEFTMPLLGILALKNIFEKKVTDKEILKAIKYSAGILIGLALLFILNPGILSFTSDNDSRLPEYLISAIKEDRASMMRTDALRSIIFVLIGAGGIWLFVKQKLKKNYILILLGLAVLVDLWGVDKRYLNSDNFVNKKKVEVPFMASEADKMILQDNSPDYRVLNLTVSTFNDASTSYFHKSIGGYHGAKLRRYQDLIDYKLNDEIQSIITVLQSNPTPEKIDSVLQKQSGLNMLNTKYIIYNPQAPPILNNYVFGNAWFVENFKLVNNADEEIQAIQNINPENIAVVDKRFEKKLFRFRKDEDALIYLKKYQPNKLIYQTKAKSDQFAVFSEIYYPEGWHVFVDGKPASHFRVDYVLRAMKVPSGEHTVTFEFKPESWQFGKMVSLISSIILLLSIAFVIYVYFKNKKKEEKDTE